MGEVNIEIFFTLGSHRKQSYPIKEKKNETASVLFDTAGVQLCDFNVRTPPESTDDW